MKDLEQYLTLLCLLLGSCTPVSMEWQVTNTTTVEQLNKRYTDEVAMLWQCDESDYNWLVDCPEYHVVWNRYWWARYQVENR